ncbi:MAG: hypothetical protein NVS2B7_17040 [Herpetosiphon sp.]
MSRILVLDGDHAIIGLYRELLTGEGYEVVTTELLMDLLPTVERTAPDLIIIDYMFGARPAGWELVQQLKRHPSTAQIAIVVCTDAPQIIHAHPAAALRIGLQLVVKPFVIDDILAAVDRALTHRWLAAA